MARSEDLKDAFNNSKYTIQQWSQILGVTRNTIHKWLTGVNNPKRATVIHIAEVFGKQGVVSGKNDVMFTDSGKPASDFDFGKKKEANIPTNPIRTYPLDSL
jgi:DNA-binding XRE family transcriptional regulator